MKKLLFLCTIMARGDDAIYRKMLVSRTKVYCDDEASDSRYLFDSPNFQDPECLPAIQDF